MFIKVPGFDTFICTDSIVKCQQSFERVEFIFQEKKMDHAYLYDSIEEANNAFEDIWEQIK